MQRMIIIVEEKKDMSLIHGKGDMMQKGMIGFLIEKNIK